jgi:hypothetical protein
MSRTAVVAAASWEPRFVVSLEATLDREGVGELHVLFSERYTEWTVAAREDVRLFANRRGVTYKEMLLDFERPRELWRGVSDLAEQLKANSINHLIVDGTTMPRELTWYLLHMRAEIGLPGDYVYVPAGTYGDWLSKESLPPRLVIKRSGVLFPDKSTCILAISGFDIGRLNQLVSYFEPHKLLIARQTGERYENAIRNIPQLSEYARHADIFDFDSFDVSPSSYQMLSDKIEPFLPDYNVLVASLGPKLSSVTAFELTEAFPDVALVYIPSQTYNRDYSKGAALDRRVVKRLIDLQVPSANLPLPNATVPGEP